MAGNRMIMARAIVGYGASLLLASATLVGGVFSGIPAPTENVAMSASLPYSMCFAPDTSPEYIEKVYQELMDKIGATLEFNLTTRWPGPIGTPVTLTYSFVPDMTPTENGPSELFALLGATPLGGDANGNGKPDWQDRFREMFDVWTAITGNIYIETVDDGAFWPTSEGAPGVRGDIRIAMATIDGPGNIWAFNFFPGQIRAGDMLLDRADAFAFTTAANNFRLFRNLISHEHGHGQGILHVCPAAGQTGGRTKLMEPFIVSDFDGPQLDDILASQSLYGDRFEPNNTFTTATELESLGLSSGSNLVLQQLTIVGTESDQFSFTVEAGSKLNLARAAPAGTTYLEGAQVSGVCESGEPFDALRQVDLMLQVINPSGSIIATSNATGFGQFEEITNLNLISTGKHTIRVSGAGAPIGTQLYVLTVNVDLGLIPGDINGDRAVNGIDLLTLLNAWGSAGMGGEDLNGDGVVDGSDLLILLNNWTG